MFVEASLMTGKGELILTGQLGEVMKESARAAWTFARSHASLLGIDEKDFERDIHIHVPAGAIPKDGPSAGIAMASAVASALSRRAVRNDVAMTGEITLSGRVLPIGGLKEKILGAVRAGITRIVIPRDNEPDLEDVSVEQHRLVGREHRQREPARRSLGDPDLGQVGGIRNVSERIHERRRDSVARG